MSTHLMQVIGLIAVPVVVAILAAALSLRADPGPKFMSGVQHFAAGVVLAAVAGEVLPALRGEGHIWWAAGGFVLGAALVVGLEFLGVHDHAHPSPGDAAGAHGHDHNELGDRAIHDHDAGGRDGAAVSVGESPSAATMLPLGMLVPVAVDLLMDGLLVGLGASLGFTQALILTIALTIEVLFLGISLSASLRRAGQSVGRSIAWTAGVALMMLVGAIAGAVLLDGASSQMLSAALAFGAAALLYLAVEELMSEAHENAETPWLTAMFFVGFILVYVLGAVAK